MCLKFLENYIGSASLFNVLVKEKKKTFSELYYYSSFCTPYTWRQVYLEISSIAGSAAGWGRIDDAGVVKV